MLQANLQSKLSRFFLILFVSLFVSLVSYTLIFASHCPSNNYDCQIGEIQREIDALSPAHQKNKEELSRLERQIADIKKRIDGISFQLKKLENNIKDREKALSYQQELLNARVRSFYLKTRQYSPLLVFLFADSAADLTRELAFREQTTSQDREAIEGISADLLKLKTDKESLEKNKTSLGLLQKSIGQKADFLAGEVKKVETYISSLSAKQQQLITLKSAGFQTSVGDTPETSEPCSGPPGSGNFCDPGFRPAYGGFSFGAPHRKGMSQYGAKGRADAGQNEVAILKAYYGPNIEIREYPMPAQINTSIGRLAFEERYLRGIAEMPSSWNLNALKAQAIAARTYALSYVGWRVGNQNASGRICVTEACQVYKNSKADNPGAWGDAVAQTRGKVVVSSATGEIFSTWYASTAGGFTFSYSSLGHATPGGWDAEGGQGSWPGNAWDKKGGSPWFYKGWYKTRGGQTCGRGNPWLTSEEMADILNAWQVLYKGGGDVSKISPVDTGCWPGNPYSKGDLAAIGGFTSVSGVSVIYDNGGFTQSTTFNTNKGTVTIPGEEIKKAFNLRAPGYIGIKSSLFNIEKL